MGLARREGPSAELPAEIGGMFHVKPGAPAPGNVNLWRLAGPALLTCRQVNQEIGQSGGGHAGNPTCLSKA